MMIIAERLHIPQESKAILWDMDGVLLDTLGLDLTICNQLLRQHFGENILLTKEFIRSIFAYHPPEFWRLIFEFVKNKYGISGTESDFSRILEIYNQARNDFVFEVNPGICDILENARKIPLKLAVVSNNPTDDLEKILSKSGISDYFDLIVGNDVRDLRKKPAPDTYLFAAETLGIPPKHCAVIEDSLVGAEAGHRAGCFTVGVATGGNDFEALEQSPCTDMVCSSFRPNHLQLKFGKVTKKNIFTPNEFVSHMLEHIVWRMCCEADIYWNSNDWFLLGKRLGKHIRGFEHKKNRGVALGMIDDGSAEVFIDLSGEADAEIDSVEQLDPDWFLSLRCEQLDSGKPLTRLIQGLARGLEAKICVRVCSVEDPHHTWEGIFRSIGIALNQMFTPEISQKDFSGGQPEKNVSQGAVSVNARSCEFAEITRETAESSVRVAVDFSEQMPPAYRFQVSPAINVDSLRELLDILARKGGFTLQVDFDATVLSSSHVVAEDISLVLGRALKEILVLRMREHGVNAAGSSLTTPEDFDTQPIRVGVSVEGRKFWKLVAFNESADDVRKKFVIGQNVCDCLKSEDLDDFLDGLAGGLNCSIMVHMKEMTDPDKGWQMIFAHLGKALEGVFAPNPYRKGVSPGVKATLA